MRPSVCTGELPMLGVCLGHQSIGQATGGEIVRARSSCTAKPSIHHDGQGCFAGLPNPFTATRYHSLVIRPDTLSSDYEMSAWAAGPDGSPEIMGVRHEKWAVEGWQFHPESFLTECGHELLHRFLQLRCALKKPMISVEEAQSRIAHFVRPAAPVPGGLSARRLRFRSRAGNPGRLRFAALRQVTGGRLRLDRGRRSRGGHGVDRPGNGDGRSNAHVGRRDGNRRSHHDGSPCSGRRGRSCPCSNNRRYRLRKAARKRRIDVRQSPVKAGQKSLRRARLLKQEAPVSLTAGRRIRPIEIGLLAEMGHTTVPVFPQPAVSVLATGDELIAVGNFGRARANLQQQRSPGAANLVRQANCVAQGPGIARRRSRPTCSESFAPD